MKIDRIYIACYRHDYRFTKILVSSIRFWYPDIPISLIKDETYGPFDTSELERSWRVEVMPTPVKMFGWGFGKLEPLFLPEKQRCLILDSDIVFVGPVIDVLEQYDEDFLVTHEDPPDQAFVERLYFHLDELKKLDATFEYPGFTFNTGQIVATSGILKREDFDPFVQWGSPPALKQGEIFECGEQGLLNYLLMKKAAAGSIRLARVPFMEVASNEICQTIRLDDLTSAGKFRFLIHWCGLTRDQYSPGLSAMIRKDILLHFEDLYYRKVGPAWLSRWPQIYCASLSAAIRSSLRQFPAAAALRRLFKPSAS